jgi:hypothetical protein
MIVGSRVVIKTLFKGTLCLKVHLYCLCLLFGAAELIACSTRSASADPVKVESAGTRLLRVQSLFELTNSKPTKLALKAVPSDTIAVLVDRESSRRERCEATRFSTAQQHCMPGRHTRPGSLVCANLVCARLCLKTLDAPLHNGVPVVPHSTLTLHFTPQADYLDHKLSPCSLALKLRASALMRGS